MTKHKIEADRILVNFLKVNLDDVNATRSGNWIYPDFPLVSSLGDNQFPRVGITILSESSDFMEINGDNNYHTVTFQVDVVSKKDLLHSLTVTNEALGTVSATINSNRFTYDFVPTTITNIKHNTIAFGTVTQKATDEVFTTPASLAAGTVEYSYATGTLNFSAADVTSYDTQAITSTYVVSMSGKKAVQHLARQIWKEIRNNWRTDMQPRGLFAPKLLANNPIPIDEELGIFRQTLEIQFNAFNIGEGL